MLGKIFPRVAAVAGGFALLTLLAAGSAQAVNSVGWVLADQPDATTDYAPQPKYSFNSANGAITIGRQEPGLYLVEFANLYDGSPSNVQVVAYNTSGSCQVPIWVSQGQPDPKTLIVNVQCYDAKGNKANAAFTLLYQARNAPFGGATKGVAFAQAGGGREVVVETPKATFNFNSTGGTNTFVYNKQGNYTVTLPGLTKLGGDVQVTAASGTSLFPRCKPVTWSSGASSTTVTVQCYTSGGLPNNALFDLAYAVGEPVGVTPGVDPRSAWAYANDPTSTAAYQPILTYQYNGFGTGRLTAQKTGTGLYTVTIPGTLNYNTSVAMVTATGPTSDYCNLVSWTASTIDVACFRQGGVPADSRFEVSLETAN